jgi:tripartite-type tricarboxylate transporter receptor subunit TctC
MKRRELLSAAALTPLALAASHTLAQQGYPTKSIRFVVPFAPGGTSEIVARAVAMEMTAQMGQTTYVENKAGGAGTIAMAEVAKAAPDGYTLIESHVGSFAVNPYAMARQPYDVNKDFLPVALMARVPSVYVITAALPVKDFKEFIALAKAKPGTLNYGSAGNGSSGHLAFEYLKLVAGIDIIHVPYRGTGPQLQDLLAGRTDASNAGLPALIAHIKSGKLRAIAVGTPQRVSALPDVPTVAEMGYPDFETSQWYGMHVPAGTPREIVLRLNGEVNRALKSRNIGVRFAADNAEPGGGTPEDYGAFVAKEQARWKEVVQRGNIKIES